MSQWVLSTSASCRLRAPIPPSQGGSPEVRLCPAGGHAPPWQPAAHKGLRRKGFSPVYWHLCVVAVLKVLTVSPAITYNWLLFFHVPPGNSSSSQARGGVLGLGRLLWAGEVCENGQDGLRKGNVAPSCLSIPPKQLPLQICCPALAKAISEGCGCTAVSASPLGWANPLALVQ